VSSGGWILNPQHFPQEVQLPYSFVHGIGKREGRTELNRQLLTRICFILQPYPSLTPLSGVRNSQWDKETRPADCPTKHRPAKRGAISHWKFLMVVVTKPHILHEIVLDMAMLVNI
jgi:hypothetical protein